MIKRRMRLRLFWVFWAGFMGVILLITAFGVAVAFHLGVQEMSKTLSYRLQDRVHIVSVEWSEYPHDGRTLSRLSRRWSDISGPFTGAARASFFVLGPSGSPLYEGGPGTMPFSPGWIRERSGKSASGTAFFRQPSGGVYIVAWSRVAHGRTVLGSLNFSHEIGTLMRELGNRFLSDVWLPVSVATAFAYAFSRSLSRSVRRLTTIGDSQTARSVKESARVREVADIASRWEMHLREREDALHHAEQELYWRKQATEWISLLRDSGSAQETANRILSILPWATIVLYDIRRDENALQALAVKGLPSNSQGLRLRLRPPGSIAAWTAVEQRTIWLRSKEDWEDYAFSESRALLEEIGAEVGVGLALIHENRPVGVMVAADRAKDLSDAAVSTLESLAPILSALLVRQRLVGELEEENRALRGLQEAVDELLQADSQETLWRVFATALESTGQASGGSFAAWIGNKWSPAGTFGTLDGLFDGREDLQGLYSFAFESPLADRGGARMVWRRYAFPKGGESLRTWRVVRYYLGNSASPTACVCLVVGEGTVAERVAPLWLHSFNLAHRTVTQRSELAYLGRHDGLTGVLNRRGLEALMEEYFNEESPPSAALVLFDLDNFKTLNDLRGHQTGDEALREIAYFWSRALPEPDAVARLGGDEFVLLIKNAPEDSRLVARLRQLSEESPARRYGLGVTMGVVRVPDEGRTFAECYRLADDRLYAGKRAGKWRIVDRFGTDSPVDSETGPPGISGG